MSLTITNTAGNAARRYIDINSDIASSATEKLASGSLVSNPSYDPSAAAVGYNFTANIKSLDQASRNVLQGTAQIQMVTGFLGASVDVLIRMKQLTVAANTDTVGDPERAKMNAEYQQLVTQLELNAQNARWGGVSLLANTAPLVQTIQYAERSTDTLTVTFNPADVTALGFGTATVTAGVVAVTSTSDITSKANAATASALIDTAISTINTQIGELGGKASEFKFMTDTLRINIQNSTAARSTFTDADISQSMQDLQTYSGLGQIAQTVFTKALNDHSSMVQMVQSVR